MAGSAARAGKDQPSSEPSGNQPMAAADLRRPTNPTTAAPAWQPPAYDPQQQQYPQYPQQPGPGATSRRTSTRRPSNSASSPASTARRAYPSQYPHPASPASTASSTGSSPHYGQQPGAQYGQQPTQYGQQPGQYGQYPQYGATPGAEEGSKKSLAVIGGVVGLLAALIVAVVLVLGFWKPGFFVTTKLDVSAAQSGVQQILTDEANGYGAKNVKDVKCNDGQSPDGEKG